MLSKVQSPARLSGILHLVLYSLYGGNIVHTVLYGGILQIYSPTAFVQSQINVHRSPNILAPCETAIILDSNPPSISCYSGTGNIG